MATRSRQPEDEVYSDNTYALPGPESLAIAPVAPGGTTALAPSYGGMPPVGAAPETKGSAWLLTALWRQKWLVLAAILLGALGGAAYLKLKLPTYTSTARIRVQPVNRSLIGGQPGVTQTGGNYLFTEREMITSEPVLAIVAARVGDCETLRQVAPDMQVTALKELVTADVEKDRDIIAVVAASPKPEDAQAIANATIDAYKAYQRQPKAGNTPETLEVLRKKKEALEDELKAKATQLTAMEMEHGMLSRNDDRTNLNIQRLQKLSEALLLAQREASDARSAFEEAQRTFGARAPKIKVEGGMDDFPVYSPQEQAVLRAEMLQTQTLLLDHQQRYLPSHPTVIGLKNRLEQLNISYLASIERRHLTAKRRAEDTQAAYDAEQKLVVEQSAHAAEYVRVREDVDRLKKLRDDYDSGIRNMELYRDAGGLNIDDVEKGRVEAKPTYPKRPQTMLIAVAVGLMCGMMLACMREWVDDRFASATDIRSSLGMPVLAVIPTSPTRRSPSVSGQRILLDPGSDAAEAYRSLRTAVQFSAPEGELRTLLVTSSVSGDGKTTLVSNLAIAMAQGGKKVLVVDADLRKPSQHEIFGVKNNTGLSALLAGRCSLETAIQRTNVQNLEILPCGPVPANPNEVLNSREFGETLEQLVDRYDCVVLDSPPVEAATDARIIAASCDATLIVLKAQTAHRRQTEKTRDALLSVGARIIGVVVNDTPRRPTNGYGHQNAQNRRMVAGLTSQEHDLLQSRPK